MTADIEADLRRQIAELDRANSVLNAALEIERRRSVDSERKLLAVATAKPTGESGQDRP